MNRIEEMLNIKKEELEQIEAPQEMEMRLQDALKNHHAKTKIMSLWKAKVAAAVILVILVGYNFDTLGYYGKKLMGYDEILNGTLKQLNDLGKGQDIGKSYKFKNGVVFTLDGIMLDDNQLLVYYSVKDPSGKVDEINLKSPMYINGLFGRYMMNSGYGNMNDTKTEIHNVDSFEKPKLFEKKLSIEIELTNDKEKETGEISFIIDRNKAMGHSLKKIINEKVKVDETLIHFNTITASPTTTVIKGSVEGIVNLAEDTIKGERFRPNDMQVKLIADGKDVAPQSSGMSTDLKGITFYEGYDALPTDLKELQLVLVSFGADHDVKKQIELTKGSKNKTTEIMDQNIQINNVYEENGDTYINITTSETTVLTRVHLIIDGKSVELNNTILDKHDKKEDGMLLHTRTLHFPGKGSKLQMNIERMTYSKIYNKVINIKIN